MAGGSVLQNMLGKSSENDIKPAASDTNKTKAVPREKSFAMANNDSSPTKQGKAIVPADCCCLWRFADRPQDELDHVNDVAESMRNEGQIQDVIVRPISPDHPDSAKFKYEVIAGQVRWRAALLNKSLLNVDIRNIDDIEADAIMTAENEHRKGLSDYARALHLLHLIEGNIYPNKQSLAEAKKINNATLSQYLKIARIPDSITKVIPMKSIAFRTAYFIAGACDKGFTDEIIQLKDALTEGSISTRQLEKQIEQWSRNKKDAEVSVITNNIVTEARAVQFRSSTGQHLFSARQRSRKGPIVSFPKSIEHIFTEQFLERIQHLVEDELSHNSKDPGQSL